MFHVHSKRRYTAVGVTCTQQAEVYSGKCYIHTTGGGIRAAGNATVRCTNDAIGLCAFVAHLPYVRSLEQQLGTRCRTPRALGGQPSTSYGMFRTYICCRWLLLWGDEGEGKGRGGGGGGWLCCVVVVVVFRGALTVAAYCCCQIVGKQDYLCSWQSAIQFLRQVLRLPYFIVCFIAVLMVLRGVAVVFVDVKQNGTQDSLCTFLVLVEFVCIVLELLRRWFICILIV